MDGKRNRVPSRPRRRPWLALSFGGGLPAALAAVQAPWLAVATLGLFNALAIAAIYLFMEGAGPAQEWATAWEAWRVLRESSRRPRSGKFRDRRSG